MGRCVAESGARRGPYPGVETPELPVEPDVLDVGDAVEGLWEVACVGLSGVAGWVVVFWWAPLVCGNFKTAKVATAHRCQAGQG